MTAENLPILAGVDSSEPSAAAVRWAVSEAQFRRRPLWLVHAYAVPLVTTPMLGPPYDWQEDATRGVAEQVLGAAVEAARDEAPDIAVSGELVLGSAGEVLVELSGRAHLVVAGDRGHGGFSALLLGSVAAKLAAHASGPVIVTRSLPPRPGPTGDGAVVVGVDGSVTSHAAIGFAFEEADLRGVPLRAVHSWQPPGPPGRVEVRLDRDDLAANERQKVAQWLRPWEQKYPQVPVSSTLTTAHAAGALVEAGRDATMLVVGSRGRGAFTGLLGSVSQQVIHHAPCPVAVVR
jgi:nucleotide-binding universal stress UspA family protein